jgi:hypothetical protein
LGARSGDDVDGGELEMRSRGGDAGLGQRTEQEV